MSYIQNFFTSRDNNANTETYVGQKDRLWYNPDTNSIRISDGVTPGGQTIDLDLGANATFDIATANTVVTKTLYANSGTVYGELTVAGNISPAANGKIGGIQPGPGVIISNSGLLTIDSANIPFSFGNFYANNNILSITNVDEDMILAASGNAEIQLTGNVGFYKPDGFPPNVANRYFFANQDGQIEIVVPGTDPNSGAVNIIGSTSGNFQTPVNSGVMLQLTGQTNTPSRLYNDAIGAYSGFIARRYNGTATSPTPVQAGEEIARIGINAYKGSWLNIGQARIDFVSTDNQDNANNGARIEFWSTPQGNTTANITKVLELNASYGANVAGNLKVTGNINGNVSGTNLIANLITGTVTTNAQPNITSLGTLTSLSVSGNVSSANTNVSANIVVGNNVRFDVAQNNATATQLTSKSTTVTCNGRTGQITMSNSSIAKGEAITFTVNNTAVTAITDVPLLAIQNGATPNSYSMCVSRVQVGSFNITLTNNGAGPLTDTIVINFAILKVS